VFITEVDPNAIVAGGFECMGYGTVVQAGELSVIGVGQVALYADNG
jgi:hypothetical protein